MNRCLSQPGILFLHFPAFDCSKRAVRPQNARHAKESILWEDEQALLVELDSNRVPTYITYKFPGVEAKIPKIS